MRLSALALSLLLVAGCSKPAAPPPPAPPVPAPPEATAAPVTPAAPPKEALGEQRAVSAADAAIHAEKIVGDYRIGMGVDAATTLYLPGVGARIPDKPQDSGKAELAYMIVTVREVRTKRHLPRAKVTVSIPRGAFEVPALPLLEVWGDYAHYAANVPVTRLGHELQLTVNVSPPQYGRHGDCLTLWDKPVSTQFILRREGSKLTVTGDSATPADAGWTVGEDVVDALREASQVVDAGPYTAGLVIEGPEPVWRWDQGKPIPEPVPDQATNHLEIVLIEAESGRMVTGAGVTLTLTPGESGRPPIRIPLIPLMSSFHHYGATVFVPPGTYDVAVRVQRPTFTTLRADRLALTLSFAFPKPWIRTP